jgi:predicted alpha/beta hydrolase family esterase
LDRDKHRASFDGVRPHANKNFVRVQRTDWDNPICAEWVAVIEEAVKRARPDVVLVAHNSQAIGCYEGG